MVVGLDLLGGLVEVDGLTVSEVRSMGRGAFVRSMGRGAGAFVVMVLELVTSRIKVEILVLAFTNHPVNKGMFVVVGEDGK